MEKELKVKWVNALRSGKYEQGRGQLRSPSNRFCCLGVLADVIDDDGWTKSSYDEEPGYKWKGYWGLLPHTIIYDDIQSKLSSLNDDDKLSFKEIADFIDNNL